VTIFEFLLTLYAIVAGLGISLLIRSIGQMIEARDRVRLYWVHTCWIGLAFVAHVVSWFTVWAYAGHAPWTVLEALLLLCTPILLYLISHLAVPELEDGAIHDLRAYYFRHARWTQSLMLAVLAASVIAHQVIENELDLSEGLRVRLAMAIALVPGIISLRPGIHAAQAVALVCAMAFGISYVSAPIQ
jgi:hypothetical protein